MTDRVANLSPRLRALLGAAGLVIVIAGVRSASSIIAPLLLASFIAAVSLPVLEWLRQRGARTGLAILAVVMLAASILAFFVWIVVRTVAEVRLELPNYVEKALAYEQTVRIWLEDMGVQGRASYFQEFVQPERLLDIVTMAARNITSVLALFLVILLYLVFILAESVELPRKIRHVFGSGGNAFSGAATAVRQVQRYLALKTVISLVTGATIGIGAWLLGVDFALFWGFLAFALNYIPTIGSIIAAVPAVAVALLQFGPGRALGLAAIFLSVNVIVGNFADPILVGRQLRLSPIIVLVSLVFWGWTLGLTGMFLAVPLTIAVRIALQNTPSLARYAALLGPVETRERKRAAIGVLATPQPAGAAVSAEHGP